MKNQLKYISAETKCSVPLEIFLIVGKDFIGTSHNKYLLDRISSRSKSFP